MYDKLFLALLESSSAHAEASRAVFSVLGLSAGQPKVLYILRRTGGIVQKELAALCNVKESTLTVLLGKIERAGLVRRERRRTAGGKSSVVVSLTEEGAAMAERLEDEVEALEARGFSGFSREEREALLSMLARVTRNLKEK